MLMQTTSADFLFIRACMAGNGIWFIVIWSHSRIFSNIRSSCIVGEKPYECSHEGCNKRFTEYSSLYKHQVVHSGAKPYTCNHCGKLYRQVSTLAMHKRTVHGENDMTLGHLIASKLIVYSMYLPSLCHSNIDHFETIELSQKCLFDM